MVYGVRRKVQGAGCMAQGSREKVRGSGSNFQGFSFNGLKFGFKVNPNIQGTGFKM